jgi:two-component system, NarL family, invasion response regulator UvrY
MKSETKIIIADDHRLMRKVLRSIFGHTSDMKVVGEARDADEVFQQVNSQDADVIVLDLHMPGKDGLEILKELHETNADLPVVVLTLFPQEKFKEKVMRLGAADFLTKDCQPQELVVAVRKATNRAA